MAIPTTVGARRDCGTPASVVTCRKIPVEFARFDAATALSTNNRPNYL